MNTAKKMPSTEDLFEEIRRWAADRAANPSDPLYMYMDDYEGKYLKSAFWRRIKKRIVARDGGSCLCCGGKASTVHHRSYDEDVIRGEADQKLATVCDGCHTIIHFFDDGRRRSDAEAEAVLAAGQRQTDFPEPTVDLRRSRPVYPENWHRMTAIQRGLWQERYKEVAQLKLAVRQSRKGLDER